MEAGVRAHVVVVFGASCGLEVTLKSFPQHREGVCVCVCVHARMCVCGQGSAHPIRVPRLQYKPIPSASNAALLLRGACWLTQLKRL